MKDVRSVSKYFQLGADPNLPPGEHLPAFRLDSEVVTCREAAAAKRIPLANELKTLVLCMRSGFLAVHVRGDQHVSIRKVDIFLASPGARMASPGQLRELGLTAGTVCPVLKPTWDLRHLISRKVLSLDFVSTNNGTRSGYFLFAPELLLRAHGVDIGDFEADDAPLSFREKLAGVIFGLNVSPADLAGVLEAVANAPAVDTDSVKTGQNLHSFGQGYDRLLTACDGSVCYRAVEAVYELLRKYQTEDKQKLWYVSIHPPSSPERFAQTVNKVLKHERLRRRFVGGKVVSE